MGLAIARTIIEAHGGTFPEKIANDGGAVFTVCLPEEAEAKSQAACYHASCELDRARFKRNG